MSKIYKCNLCGKNEMMHNVKFSSGPFLLRMKSYDGQPMRLFVYVGADYEKEYYDTLRELGIGKFYDIDEEVPVLFDSYIDEEIRVNQKGNPRFDLDLLEGQPEAITICDQCKKMLSTRVMRDSIHHSIAGSKKVSLDNESTLLESQMQELAEKLANMTEEDLKNYELSLLEGNLIEESSTESSDVSEDLDPPKSKKPRGRPKKK